MEITIDWKNIKTRVVASRFRKAVEEGVMDWLKDYVKPDLEQATSTWKHKPTFTTNKTTKTLNTRSKRFHWVNDGTTKRWALMSRNWQSKSQPGSLVAGPGAGRVRYKGMAMMKKHGYMHPRPGIVPRRFDEVSAIRQAPMMRTTISNSVYRHLPLIFT